MSSFLKTFQQAEFLTTRSPLANNLIKKQNHIMSVSAGVLLNNKKVFYFFYYFSLLFFRMK